MKKLNLCYVIEETTDIRFINGLKNYFNVTVLARKRKDYTIVPWKIPEEVETRLFHCNRLLYPFLLLIWIIKYASVFDVLVVNSDTLTGLSINFSRFFSQKPHVSLICKPTLEYLSAKYLKHKIGLLHFLFLYFLTKPLIMWNISQFDLNIVLSDYIQGKLRKYSKKKVQIIPIYGIDKVFKPLFPDKQKELRKKLNLPTDKYVIFVSSRISPEKDISTLFKATKLIIKDGIRDIVLLNLSGQYKDFISQANRIGLEKFATGRPAINPYDLPSYYQASDLCIQPSLYEGLGLSPLEALACGTPAVVSHTGGLKESTIHKVHNLHFKPGDAKDLAEKIKYAYTHRKEMKSMAERGMKWVKRQYNSEKVFRKFNDVIEKLLR